jgi:hypothetical protein
MKISKEELKLIEGFVKDATLVKEVLRRLGVDNLDDDDDDDESIQDLNMRIDIKIPYGSRNADEWSDLLDGAFTEFVDDIHETIRLRQDTFGTEDIDEDWDHECGEQTVTLTDLEDDEVMMKFKVKALS